MNTWNIIFHMLKADFLERTRRYSFLLTLCLAIYLGYMVNAGKLVLHLDHYRGVFNSAWVGTLIALVISFFLGIFGFYLVKNSIERDVRTGVGQIIATTPLTKVQYVLGKWLSNFAVLSALVLILALAGLLMQLIQREDPTLRVWPLMAPILLIALPMMAVVASLAVFFECVPWLRGGFGNIVYFVLIMFLIVNSIENASLPWLDMTGVSQVMPPITAAAQAAFPAYQGGFGLTFTQDSITETFVWNGVDWTAGLIAQRLGWILVAVAISLLGSLFFDRFDTSRGGVRVPRRRKAQPAPDSLAVVEIPTPLPSAAGPAEIHLTPLSADLGSLVFHPNFIRLVWLEAKLLVKGLKWYWYAVAAGLWLAGLLSPAKEAQEIVLVMVAIWPVLVWSRLGVREAYYQTGQLVFPSVQPLLRLLASTWLAGVLLTALLTSSVAARLVLAGQPSSLAAWLLAALFIPSLALALGVWSHSSKLFEVVYLLLWYIGAANRAADLDYLGVTPQGLAYAQPLLLAGLILGLCLLALLGRQRQLRSD